ncbi:hypothetical protein [Henriciella sp.]|uniref:hypothetical protein n=1 Tax=Henriciella sp. TaxID=1968823 RepID=UPI00262DD89A|nr:hypothetical protein [Henriciella sp.]
MRIKTLRNAAKLAQMRAHGDDRATIKRARQDRCVESVMGLIRKYVSEDDFHKITKRGCLHVADFPEKQRRKEERAVRT